MSDFLSDDRIEAALLFLANSAKDYAEAKGQRVWLEHRMKTVKAQVLLANEGTVSEREARAYASDEFKGATDEMKDAVVKEETLRALRVAAEAKIDVFRTLEASKRASNV